MLMPPAACCMLDSRDLAWAGLFASTESDINIRLAKVWNTLDRLSIIWKSDSSDIIKWNILQAVAMSILLYGCTKWTPTEHLERKREMGTLQECYVLFWINPGGNIQQNGNYTATYLLFHKLYY